LEGEEKVRKMEIATMGRAWYIAGFELLFGKSRSANAKAGGEIVTKGE